MTKTTKTTTKTTTETPKKVAKATKPKKEIPAPVPVPEPEENVEVEAEVEEEDELDKLVTEYLADLHQVSVLNAGLKNKFKVIEKLRARRLKAADKASKKKRKGGNRAPTGFVKPAPISDELAAFFGLPSGTEMARTEATKKITEYIKEHKLENSKNGRKIDPDEPLKKLLNVTNQNLEYFNLQTYIKHHFPKSKAALQAEAASA